VNEGASARGCCIADLKAYQGERAHAS